MKRKVTKCSRQTIKSYSILKKFSFVIKNKKKVQKDKRKSSNKRNGNSRIVKDMEKRHIFIYTVATETNENSNAYTPNKYHLLTKETGMSLFSRKTGRFLNPPSQKKRHQRLLFERYTNKISICLFITCTIKVIFLIFHFITSHRRRI